MALVLRTARSNRLSMVLGLWTLAAMTASPAAQADPTYTITDIGFPPGYRSRQATAVNNAGQVVGVNENSTSTTRFLYSNGQLTQIGATGGLPLSIDDLGQVVGGSIDSINDSGQTASPDEPIDSSAQAAPLTPENLVPTGTWSPIAINNAGEMAGNVYIPKAGSLTGLAHPAVLENGQITDHFRRPAFSGSSSGGVFFHQSER